VGGIGVDATIICHKAMEKLSLVTRKTLCAEGDSRAKRRGVLRLYRLFVTECGYFLHHEPPRENHSKHSVDSRRYHSRSNYLHAASLRENYRCFNGSE
jgi:hypothetical protein